MEFFLLTIRLQKPTNMNKYIKTTKIFRKPVVSKPLISIVFNGDQ